MLARLQTLLAGKAAFVRGLDAVVLAGPGGSWPEPFQLGELLSLSYSGSPAARRAAKRPSSRTREQDHFLDCSWGMENIGKLRIGTAALDITLERRPSVVTLRIGDEDPRWRAERAAGPAAGADLWRYVKAAAHRAVADYLELGTRPAFENAATAVYVEVGALGIVRAELGDGDSTEATARLMTKVGRRLARLEHEVVDGQGRRMTVTIPE